MRSYIFATYNTDRQKFKIRNRVLLGFFFLLVLSLFIYTSDFDEKTDIVFIEDTAATAEKSIESIENLKITYTLKDIEEIAYRDDSIEKVDKEIEKKDKTEEIEKNEHFYFIQVGTIKYMESFQNNFDKLKELNFNYKIEKTKDSMIVLVGPLNGYSKAKQNIELIKKELKIKDAFITF